MMFKFFTLNGGIGMSSGEVLEHNAIYTIYYIIILLTRRSFFVNRDYIFPYQTPILYKTASEKLPKIHDVPQQVFLLLRYSYDI